MMLLHGTPSREVFLEGFWSWVGLLAAGRAAEAVDALFWPLGAPSPLPFVERYQVFWGKDRDWRVVIPNERLVRVVNNDAVVEIAGTEAFGPARVLGDGWPGAAVGWGRAQVPVTPAPDRAKDDDVELMGVATSFFLVDCGDALTLAFEIIHV